MLVFYSGTAIPEVPEGKVKVMETDYCSIHYRSEDALKKLFWRISGKRFKSIEDILLERKRVDRIVERVQSILEMRPRKFNFKIDLYMTYSKGDIALYNAGTNTIIAYADKITDGVLAHEIAHAVICNYFEILPPYKTQEILARYVDQHLWNDY